MKRNYLQFLDNCFRVKISTINKDMAEIVLSLRANRPNIIIDIVLLFSKMFAQKKWQID